MASTTRVLLVTILLYAAVCAAVLYVIAGVVKYLIRYGVDYYFKKLAEHEQKTGGKSL